MPSAIAASTSAVMTAFLLCRGVASCRCIFPLVPRTSYLLDDRRDLERVVGHGRGQVRPLERVGSLPLLLLRGLAAANRRDDVVEKDQLRGAEEESADRRPH